MRKEKILVVVDMQNDFIDGVLGTKEAQAIVPKVAEKIKSYTNRYDPQTGMTWRNPVVYTMDTHGTGYLKTQEGIKLPVEHVIYPSNGWMLNEDVAKEIILAKGFKNEHMISPQKEFRKSAFGSEDLVKTLRYGVDQIESIELIGVLTGACVISNAILLKTAMPEIPIIIDNLCCACATPKSHKIALEAMKMCQIEIINE